MSALEREIVEKFHQLDKDAQKRVRDLIAREMTPGEQADVSAFDYDVWFHDVETLREEMSASQGEKQTRIDVVSLLRDIRDGEDE